MQENAGQNNSEYGHFLRSGRYDINCLNSANMALKSYFQMRNLVLLSHITRLTQFILCIPSIICYKPFILIRIFISYVLSFCNILYLFLVFSCQSTTVKLLYCVDLRFINISYKKCRYVFKFGM